MFEPVFRLGSFGRSLQWNREILMDLLACLVAIDRRTLARMKLPPLYQSGVRYQREPLCRFCEEWRDVLCVLSERGGDCEDLASWRVAELQNQGVAARPYVKEPKVINNRVLMYHIQVQLPGGRIEDPSALLGMETEQFHAFSGYSHSARRRPRPLGYRQL